MRLPEVLHASPRICGESSVFHQCVLTKQHHIHAQACMHAYKHSHTQTLVRLYYLLDLFTRDKGGNVEERGTGRVRKSMHERETAVEVQEVKVTREKPCTIPDI